MYRTSSVFKVALIMAFIFAFTVVSMPHAHANNQPCTQEDKNAIKKFDKLAKNKIKRLDEYTEKIKKAKKEERYGSKIKSIMEFFRSDRFKEMEKVYERCDKKIPRPNVTPVQFWMPDRYRPS